LHVACYFDHIQDIIFGQWLIGATPIGIWAMAAVKKSASPPREINGPKHQGIGRLWAAAATKGDMKSVRSICKKGDLHSWHFSFCNISKRENEDDCTRVVTICGREKPLWFHRLFALLSLDTAT
jgi:hypothetical protein